MTNANKNVASKQNVHIILLYQASKMVSLLSQNVPNRNQIQV